MQNFWWHSYTRGEGAREGTATWRAEIAAASVAKLRKEPEEKEPSSSFEMCGTYDPTGGPLDVALRTQLALTVLFLYWGPFWLIAPMGRMLRAFLPSHSRLVSAHRGYTSCDMRSHVREASETTTTGTEREKERRNEELYTGCEVALLTQCPNSEAGS